jgi:hypothetical protein
VNWGITEEQRRAIEQLRKPAMMFRLVRVRVEALVRLRQNGHEPRAKHNHRQDRQERVSSDVR